MELLLADLIESVALGDLSPEDSVSQYNDQIEALVGADNYAGG